MAQKMVDISKNAKRSVATQTGIDEELHFYIADKKHAKVYFSQIEKEKLFRLVVNTKSVALNQGDWKIFRNCIYEIDKFMLQDGSK